MTRLLYVFNIPGFFVNQRLHLAKAARERGYEVHVATSETGPEARIKEEGFPFHPVAMDRKGIRPWEEVPTLKRLYDLYQKVEPDLIENATIKPVLYGGLVTHLLEGPAMVNWITGLGHVFTDSGLWVGMLRRLVQLGYRGALAHERSITIFKNPDDQELFVDAGLVLARRTTVIRGAGVDTNRFRPAGGGSDGAPLVVMAARMLWPKGVAEFVEAARMLRRRGTSARFALVGDADPGNPQTVPPERLQAWDEEGPVEWWGYRQDMPEVLRGASVFCLPSYYREGVPKALLEAAATGLPLVTTDAPGCREVVLEGENGLLVRPRDSEELAEREFSNERVVEKTLSIYQQVLTMGNEE